MARESSGRLSLSSSTQRRSMRQPSRHKRDLHAVSCGLNRVRKTLNDSNLSFAERERSGTARKRGGLTMTASGSTSSELAQPVIELDVSAVRGRLAAHRRAQETGRQDPPGSPGCPPAGTRPSGARSGPRRGFPKRFRPAGLHRARQSGRLAAHRRAHCAFDPKG